MAGAEVVGGGGGSTARSSARHALTFRRVPNTARHSCWLHCSGTSTPAGAQKIDEGRRGWVGDVVRGGARAGRQAATPAGSARQRRCSAATDQPGGRCRSSCGPAGLSTSRREGGRARGRGARLTGGVVDGGHDVQLQGVGLACGRGAKVCEVLGVWLLSQRRARLGAGWVRMIKQGAGKEPAGAAAYCRLPRARGGARRPPPPAPPPAAPSHHRCHPSLLTIDQVLRRLMPVELEGLHRDELQQGGAAGKGSVGVRGRRSGRRRTPPGAPSAPLPPAPHLHILDVGLALGVEDLAPGVA